MKELLWSKHAHNQGQAQIQGLVGQTLFRGVWKAVTKNLNMACLDDKIELATYSFINSKNSEIMVSTNLFLVDF